MVLEPMTIHRFHHQCMTDQVITEKNMYVTLSFQHFLYGIKRKLYTNIFSTIMLINSKFTVTNLGRLFLAVLSTGCRNITENKNPDDKGMTNDHHVV